MFDFPRKFKPIIPLSILLALALVTIFGCGNEEKETATKPSATNKISVAVSIVPEASFVKAIGEEKVEVFTMIPPGASPENYAPAPRIMEQLSRADIYFAIGVPAEVNGILPRLKQINPDMKVIDLPRQVDKVYPAREITTGGTDPHRWMSPKRVIIMVRSIADELSVIDAQNRETYQKNAKNYIDQLERLDAEITSTLAGISGLSFIVYHPSMGYFADDYALNMIALEEEGKEATVRSIQALIDQAKKENIKVVFYQAEMDSKQAQTLARELGGEAELIAPLAPDYLENMDKIARLFSHLKKP